MTNNKYCTVETTNVSGKCFDFISENDDIENGFVAAKGELKAGERNIWLAQKPAVGDEIFLAANPAWSYESGLPSSQDEDKFINPAGKPFRVYGLSAADHDKFGIAEYGITSTSEIEVGSYITVDGISYKLKNAGKIMPSAAETGFIGKVVEIESTGAVFTAVNDGSAENSGRKVIVEVIKNSSVIA